MSHERIKYMKESLMSCIEGQICNIQEVDAEELGCAIDMLKDLEEALYFSTITEAMKGKKKGGNEYEFEYNVDKQHENSRMYNSGQNRSYQEPMMDYGRMYNDGTSSIMYASGSNNSSSGGRNGSSSRDYSEPMSMRSEHEGRSPQMRRMYMESKSNHQDKATQLRELEKYMQELSSDITEMISDASSEEKQYLEKKMTTLANKIGQMK